MRNVSTSAKRIRLLRNMIGLSVLDLAEALAIGSKIGFNLEQEHFGGLTLGWAKSLVKLSREHGVVCDLRWLMEGNGHLPYFIENEGYVLEDEVQSGINLRELQQEMMRVLTTWQSSTAQEPIPVNLSMHKIGYFMPSSTFAEFYSLNGQQQKEKAQLYDEQGSN